MLQRVKNSQAYGNAEVQDLLKHWLKIAKEGSLCHVTLTACQQPNLMATDFAGTGDLGFAVPFVLDMMKIKLKELERITSGPPQEEGITADYVTYNLGDSPVSFDFLSWLVAAE